MKQLERIYDAPNPHMVGDGFRVHNFIPSQAGLSMNRMDPFIMLDYGSKYHFPASQQQKGVGVHPHRGFSTVTIAYEGEVSHHDSAGNSGTIKAGGVQWMKAASGVLHKEYHSARFTKTGGDFQMVQLWVNLPANHKMDEPNYWDLQKEEINTFKIGHNQIQLISGELLGQSGSVNSDHPVTIANIEVADEIQFVSPEDFTTGMIIISGEGKVQNREVKTNQFILFSNQGEEINIETSNGMKVLFLSAEPIKEPIAAHGPFVMNSQAEIMQAFEDFEKGKFGQLT